VPAAAVPEARVRVDEPEPGAPMEVGLNDALAPEGTPEAERETAELKPPETLVETVAVELLPVGVETEVGETAIEKSGVADVVTVNETVVEWVFPPPVPVTVTV
jgi:hypothetical protein